MVMTLAVSPPVPGSAYLTTDPVVTTVVNRTTYPTTHVQVVVRSRVHVVLTHARAGDGGVESVAVRMRRQK